MIGPDDGDGDHGDGDHGDGDHDGDHGDGDHDGDRPAATPAVTTGTAGYDKGFYIRSDDGKFGLRLRGSIQPFYTLTRTTPGRNDLTGAFELRRARINLDGNLHGDHLRYRFQLGFDRGVTLFKDAYLEAHLDGDVWIRAGQWRRPFSRQRMVSFADLELADRAITDKAFGAGRDVGIALRNDYEASPPIEWTVGVWNGTGDGPVAAPSGTAPATNVPTEFKPAFIGRVGLNSEGIKAYTEADLEGGPLRWAAGASFWAETDFDQDQQSNDKVEIDYVLKVNGFSSNGAFYAMTRQAGVHPLSDQELAYIGFHLQAGYLLTPSFGAAARFAMVAGRADGTIGQQELTIGGTYYGWGSGAEIVGDLRFLKTGDAGKFTDAILFELGSNLGF
ncbi:MAG: porin [Kofleriaceae bacterium]